MYTHTSLHAVAAAGQLFIMGGTEFFQPPGVNCSSTNEAEWAQCYKYSTTNEVIA